ncbi:MAG: methylmalonyl-CoA epimerase [Nitrospinae bacterium]|nr:methylmalonyl-CoA epimerase [Nitrospinota bacterium]MCH7768986.1 methylmalonyl-CoA epimerase [Nitrospinota bacterium]
MLKKINHIAIAVKDVEASSRLFSEVLGFSGGGIEVFDNFEVKVAFFAIGDVKIELVEPLNPDGGVAKFLAKRGEGIHHIAFEVDDVAAALDHYKSKGVRLINERPEPGANDTLVAFLHPKSTGGVLLEILQPATSEGG